VYIKDVSLLNQNTSVWAEITNLGFDFIGETTVEFRYYATDRNGNKIGDPIISPPYTITASLLDPWERGEMEPVEDTQFIPTALSSYFVEVVVDP
jgi:hypothetical protein